MADEPVKAEHINTFVLPLLETLDRMLGIKATAKGVSIREGAGDPGAVAVLIKLSGRLSGEVFMTFGEKAGTYVASLMAKKLKGQEQSYEGLTDEAQAALKEFANVALGSTVGKLKSIEVETLISTPTIYVGPDVVAEVMAGKNMVVIPFVLGFFGQLELALSLRLTRPHVEGASAMKVMVVDDSSFQRDVLKILLTGRGYQVVAEAEDGATALKMYQEFKPDIVTLDIIMPGMDGVQTLQHLKEINPAARVIMVSSISDKDRIIECRRLGAEYYILKPYEPEKIIEVLQKLGQ